MYCRRATPEDVAYLAPRLRAVDVAEIYAAAGLTPHQSLEQGYAESDVCRVFCADDGEPVCIHGTVPVPDTGAAWAWMLGTDRIAQRPKEFLQHSRSELALFHRSHRVVFNYVAEFNATSRRYLKRLGCRFLARHERFGFLEQPFLEFIHTETP